MSVDAIRVAFAPMTIASDMTMAVGSVVVFSVDLTFVSTSSASVFANSVMPFSFLVRARSTMTADGRLKWEQESDTAETWSAIADTPETWNPIADNSEDWTSIADESENWTPIADNSEAWEIAA